MFGRPEFAADVHAQKSSPSHLPISLQNSIKSLSIIPFMTIIKKYPVAVRQINKNLLSEDTVSRIIQFLLLATIVFLIINVIREKIVFAKRDTISLYIECHYVYNSLSIVLQTLHPW
jgi:hypothetical protein